MGRGQLPARSSQLTFCQAVGPVPGVIYDLRMPPACLALLHRPGSEEAHKARPSGPTPQVNTCSLGVDVAWEGHLTFLQSLGPEISFCASLRWRQVHESVCDRERERESQPIA